MSSLAAFWRRRGRATVRVMSFALAVGVALLGGWGAWNLRPRPPHMPTQLTVTTLDRVQVAVDRPRDVSIVAVPTTPEVTAQAFDQDVILLYVEARKGESVQWAVELWRGEKPGLAPVAYWRQETIKAKETNVGWLFTGHVAGPTQSQRSDDHLAEWDLRDVVVIGLGPRSRLSEATNGEQVVHVPRLRYWSNFDAERWKPANPTLFQGSVSVSARGQMITLRGPSPNQSGDALAWDNWDSDVNDGFAWVGRELAAADRDSVNAFWSGLLAAVAASAGLSLLPLGFSLDRDRDPVAKRSAGRNLRRRNRLRTARTGRRRYVPRALRRRL